VLLFLFEICFLKYSVQGALERACDSGGELFYYFYYRGIILLCITIVCVGLVVVVLVVSRCRGIGPPSGIPSSGLCFCWPPTTSSSDGLFTSLSHSSLAQTKARWSWTVAGGPLWALLHAVADDGDDAKYVFIYIRCAATGPQKKKKKKSCAATGRGLRLMLERNKETLRVDCL